MEKDWSDILGDKLRDVQMPLPEGDWEVLQGRYAARKRAQVFRYWVSAAAVAAVILLFFFTAGGEMDRHTNDPLMANAKIAEERIWVVEHAGVPERLARLEIREWDRKESAALPDERGVIGDVSKNKQDEVVTVSDVKQPVGPEKGETKAREEEEVTDLKMYEEFWREEQVEESVKRGIKVDIGVEGGGSFGSGSQTKYLVFSTSNAIMTPVDGGPVLINPTSSVSSKEVMVDLASSEHMYFAPFTVGLSLGINFTERWRLITGLNYSMYMNKTIYDGNESLSAVSYFGIPLRVDCHIFNMDKFHLYVGAGPLIERSPSETMFLYSALATLGMQYNFNKLVGIYIEPQFTYSINIPTIESYKTMNPAVFSIGAGLRFSL